MSETSMYYELMTRIKQLEDLYKLELEREKRVTVMRLDAHNDNITRLDQQVRKLTEHSSFLSEIGGVSRRLSNLEQELQLEREKRADQLSVDDSMRKRITRLEKLHEEGSVHRNGPGSESSLWNSVRELERWKHDTMPVDTCGALRGQLERIEKLEEMWKNVARLESRDLSVHDRLLSLEENVRRLKEDSSMQASNTRSLQEYTAGTQQQLNRVVKRIEAAGWSLEAPGRPQESVMGEAAHQVRKAGRAAVEALQRLGVEKDLEVRESWHGFHVEIRIKPTDR